MSGRVRTTIADRALAPIVALFGAATAAAHAPTHATGPAALAPGSCQPACTGDLTWQSA
jgi:hypothetical protein